MTLTEEDRILIKNLYLLKGYGKTNKWISYKELEAENVEFLFGRGRWAMEKTPQSLRQGKRTRFWTVAVTFTFFVVILAQVTLNVVSISVNAFCVKHFSSLWIHFRVNLVCIKSFCQQDNEWPHAVHYGNDALFIAYKWRHSDVIIIKLTASIQNEILYKTYISNFFLYLENNRIYADLP